jgi:hypothetical protein
MMLRKKLILFSLLACFAVGLCAVPQSSRASVDCNECVIQLGSCDRSCEGNHSCITACYDQYEKCLETCTN